MQQQLSRKSFEIDQIHSLYQPKRYHNQCSLTMIIFWLGLGPFYFGYCLVYLSAISTSSLQDIYGSQILNSNVIAFLLGSITIGAAIGSIIGSFIISYLSRKQFILIINAIAFITGAIIFIPNIYVLGVCRLIQGICVGLYMAVTPIYINQICPKQLIGRYGVFTLITINIGQVIGYFIGFVLIYFNAESIVQWIVQFSFIQFTILLQTILFFFIIPQSPNSLILKGKSQQAKKVIQKFIKHQYVEQVLREKIIQVSIEEKQDNFIENKQILDYQQKNSDNTLEKLLKTPKQQIKVGWKAKFLGLQLPLMQQMCGINGINTQAGAIIKPFNPSLAAYTPLILMIVQLIGAIIPVFILEKMGRRKLSLIGNFILGICDLMIGIFLIEISWKPSQFIIISCLIVFMFIFGLTVGPIIWMYVPQILQPNFVPFATITHWIGATVCIVCLPILSKQFNNYPYPAFFAFAGWTLISFMINYIMMKQTKGLTMKEIVLLFNKQQ